MFVKLVALILVFGSSGVGLLSVRQSRLQAVHEMAEARQRIEILEEQAGEIRAKIAQSCTPDRVAQLLKAQGEYNHAVLHPARLTHGLDGAGGREESAFDLILDDPARKNEAPEASQDQVLWMTLNER